jgi:tRNA(fMet)-specific endonuclease VapC
VSLRYLLDTNAISEPLRPRPNPALLARLRRHTDEVAIASVVWHELWYGCRRLAPSPKRTAIESFLTLRVSGAMPILPYDERAAAWHATERARLTAMGKTPAFADGQIAAIAATQELILVTLNAADYAGFADLNVVDWSA